MGGRKGKRKDRKEERDQEGKECGRRSGTGGNGRNVREEESGEGIVTNEKRLV